MPKAIVRAEGITKRYRLGARHLVYPTLRDRLSSALARPWHLLCGRDGARQGETILALREVSFEVGEGEVVGLIGRNGAGKSTLLKILSRITEPTDGWAELRGRVGSLLEVGTGFHPELTGRENIYLNGAILGMKRAEIARKFDEIVAFAEIERFIDTPVKRYSSGMYLRLAFAVAAHLEPEILLVDEVLAVGDASFQRKCLNKMHDVGRSGRTVIFVSHNMPAVTRLCERAVLLDGGRIADDGPAHRVVSRYLAAGRGLAGVREWREGEPAPGNEVVRLRAVRVKGGGDIAEAVDIRRPVAIEIEYDVLRPGYTLFPHFSLHDQNGIYLFTGMDQDPRWRGRPRPPGRYRSVAWIPGNFLAEGTMIVGPAMRTIEPDVLHFYEPEAVAFQVVDPGTGDTARGEWSRDVPGVVRPLLEWETEYRPLEDAAYDGGTRL